MNKIIVLIFIVIVSASVFSDEKDFLVDIEIEDTSLFDDLFPNNPLNPFNFPDYKIEIIEPAEDEKFTLVELEPDSDIDYTIIILNPSDTDDIVQIVEID